MKKQIVSMTLIFILLCGIFVTVFAADGSTTVYITSTGVHYHTYSCRYLSKSCHAVTLDEAVNGYGYEPCSVCKPPRLTCSSTKSTSASVHYTVVNQTEKKEAPTFTFIVCVALLVSGLYSISMRSQNNTLQTRLSNVDDKIFDAHMHEREVINNYKELTRKLKQENEAELQRRIQENDQKAFELRRKLDTKDAELNVRLAEEAKSINRYVALTGELESLLKTIPEQSRAAYAKLYGGKSIIECCGAPADCYVSKDGYPARRGPLKYGEDYSVFVSGTGRCYHKKKGCSSASIEINYMQAADEGKTPCSICCPKKPDVTWFINYKRIEKIKQQYNIL